MDFENNKNMSKPVEKSNVGIEALSAEVSNESGGADQEPESETSFAESLENVEIIISESFEAVNLKLESLEQEVHNFTGKSEDYYRICNELDAVGSELSPKQVMLGAADQDHVKAGALYGALDKLSSKAQGQEYDSYVLMENAVSEKQSVVSAKAKQVREDFMAEWSQKI